MVLNRSKELKSFVKCIPVIVISFAVVMLLVWVVGKAILSDFIPREKNIDNACVNETFEDDFEDLQKVADYLISLENKSALIRTPYKPMSVDLGQTREIDSEVKEIVRKLFRRGYMNIIKNDTSIVFERWKRPFSYEFRAGFAFNFRGTDWVDVDFRINQQELEKDDWYYYEEDYNEYRITH